MMQHGGHPVGEVLGLPDPGQSTRTVLVQSVWLFVPDGSLQHLGQDADVGYGQVESLGPGRGYGVGGVAGQEQVAVPHRLADEAAEPEDHLLDDPSLLEREAVLARDAGLELGPDAIFRPGGGILVRVALEVHPLQDVAALADQRESSLGMGVDQLWRTARGLGQDAEPGERVLAEVVPPLALGYLHPADAARPVRADEMGAPDLVRHACAVGEHNPGLVSRDVDDRGLANAEADVPAVAL